MFADNPINQTILVTFMKKKRIKYETAKNGQEAVDKYKEGKFHLILVNTFLSSFLRTSVLKKSTRWTFKCQ
jgi:CheY-like chemotaxis protein